MTAYYNEIDPAAAETLRNLIDAGLIAPGVVDDRSVSDVRPTDLAGFRQCHFFAGAGLWSLALRQAGVPDSAEVWTGSCPCQPFSAAGRRDGTSDERHLWPHWFWLIRQCQPSRVFGEQVSSKGGFGWFDLVQADLEAAGYACGAEDRSAASCGAPHIRQRLWFGAARLGNADSRGAGAQPGGNRQAGEKAVGDMRAAHGSAVSLRASPTGELADTDSQGGRGRGVQRPAETSGEGVGAAQQRLAGLRPTGELANAHHAGFQGWNEQHGECADQCAAWPGGMEGGPDAAHDFWGTADWIYCRDDKWRPVEPGTFPLAHGLPKGMGAADPRLAGLAEMAGLDGASLKRAKRHRIAALKIYGNAIAPPVAAQFIRDFEEAAEAIQ